MEVASRFITRIHRPFGEQKQKPPDLEGTDGPNFSQ